MKIKLASLACALVGLTTPAAAFASSTHRAGGPPQGLTTTGRLLWNFEALLTDVFHTKAVSVSGRLNFSCAGACTPAASYMYYVRTFTQASHSTLHLSSRTFVPGAFGNYPELVHVRGMVVACDASEHHFLITYGDAVGLSLACLTPSP